MNEHRTLRRWRIGEAATQSLCLEVSRCKKKMAWLTGSGKPSAEKVRNQLEDFAGGTVVKNLVANAWDMGSSPGPGRSHMPRNN